MLICCVSAIRARAIPLSLTGFVYALLRTRVHGHYFAGYLTVTVKICTLGRNVAVALAGSLVRWGSL